MSLLCFVAAVLLAGMSPATDGGIDQLVAPYAKPDRLVALADGRVIHMRCMGRGSPTVILTAGAGDWSISWKKVQPAISRFTRTCTWDRAGFGFSSGSRLRQDIANTTSDFQQALARGGIKGPYVLVGHSRGSYETLRFKDLTPRDVRGMVLVEPSIPDQERRLRAAGPAAMRFFDGLEAEDLVSKRACATKLANQRPGGDTQVYEECPIRPRDYPKDMAQLLNGLDRDPSRWTAAVSYGEQFAKDSRRIAVPLRNYGSMPLIVLSAATPPTLDGSTPALVKKQLPAVMNQFARGHAELSRLSSRGVHRKVPRSGHYVQDDRPDAVITAITEVVAMARSQRL